MLVVRFCALAASPWPSGSHATLLRMRAGKGEQVAPLAALAVKERDRRPEVGRRLQERRGDRTAVGRPAGPALVGLGVVDAREHALLRSLEIQDDEPALLLGVDVAPEHDPLSVGREARPRVDVEHALARSAAERGHLEQRAVVRVVGPARQVEEVVPVGREGTGPSSDQVPASAAPRRRCPSRPGARAGCARPGDAREVREVAAVGRDARPRTRRRGWSASTSACSGTLGAACCCPPLHGAGPTSRRRSRRGREVLRPR